MDKRVTPPKRVISPSCSPPPPCKQALRLAKQQLCTCVTISCTFLFLCCTTTTWNCLFSRFMENENTRQRFSNSFLNLMYSPLEFNSRTIHKHCRTIHKHWTNSTSWKKSDEFWNNVNSSFKSRLFQILFLSFPRHNLYLFATSFIILG